MIDLAVLDLLADAHNPLLGIIAAALVASAAVQGQWRLTLLRVVGVAAALGAAYGVRAIDQQTGWWSRIGLDYSTQAAVALAAITYLVSQAPRLWAIWIACLAGYLMLLVALGHTPGDLASTCLAIALPLLPLSWRIGRASHRGPSRPGTAAPLESP
jgi:hypothetical protein